MPSTIVRPTVPMPSVSVSAASKYLQTSGTPIRKAIRSGLIPNLSFRVVGELAAREIVTAVTTPAGDPVPVMRLGEWADFPFSTSLLSRLGHGYRQGMSDPDLTASVRGWWTSGGHEQVEQARALMVAHGTFLLAWYDVLGVSVDPANDKLVYQVRLVARVDTILSPTVRLVAPDSVNAGTSQDVLGKRVLGGGGGTIMAV